jgi:uncharacterized protein (DUF305 family)
MSTRPVLAAAIALSALLAAGAVPAQDAPATAPDLGKHTAHAAAAPAAPSHDMPMRDKDMKDMHDMKGMHDMHGDSPSMDMHRAMMQHDMGAMKMTGDADRDFAAMMAMHHEQGIRMMEIEIAKGKNPALKAMAQKMKAQQAKEIAELKRYR